MLAGCFNEPMPRKREYQEIELPRHEYVKWKSECPFEFDVPVYAVVLPDSSIGAEPCWLNVHFPDMDAVLHLSYKNIEKQENRFDRLLEETRMLVYKHMQKADGIDEIPISIDSSTKGIRFELQGNTATGFQFFLTDKNKHYLRGALYFNQKTNADSVAPVYQHLYKDANRLIESCRWKN